MSNFHCVRTHALISFLTFALISSAQAADAKAFNPDISANFLGLYQRGTALSEDRTVANHAGFRLQEAELQFTSDVDVYFKAVALFAIGQEDGSTDYAIDPEEVYLETISLPLLTIRGGKFKLALGKHNQLHTHAFPFIDAPLFQTALIGEEGLNEAAVSAALLIPTSWYSEFTLQAFSPSNAELMGSTRSSSTGVLARLKNLWDLSDSATLELGLSGTRAQNSFDAKSTAVGADLTLKWRPTDGGKYHAFIWNAEYLGANRRGSTDSNGEPIEKLGGLATYFQYQFSERWWIQGRVEKLGLPKPPTSPEKTKQSILLGFFPSEFSGLRLQYDHEKDQDRGRHDRTVALQYNISIGAHPAHAY